MNNSIHYAVEAVVKEAAAEIKKLVLHQLSFFAAFPGDILLADRRRTVPYASCWVYSASLKHGLVIDNSDPEGPVILTPLGLFRSQSVTSVVYTDYVRTKGATRRRMCPLLLESSEAEEEQIWLRFGATASRLLDSLLVHAPA
jgi:hypothetical protein